MFEGFEQCGRKGFHSIEERLHRKDKVAGIPEILPILEIFFGGFSIGFFFESFNRENTMISNRAEIITHFYIPKTGVGSGRINTECHYFVWKC